MSATRPIDLDVERLQERVRAVYDRVARAPSSGFHFRTGPDYAVESLRYSREELATLPVACTARFAGVGNPLAIGDVPEGATVLDHACGSGMDLLLAARRVGRTGRAIGVDLTPAMRASAAQAALDARLDSIVDVREGSFEDLPVDDASVDCVVSNGVLNLAPNKERVLSEIARVLRPGGTLYLADVVVSRALAPVARCNVELWAACVAGAVVAAELAPLVASAGLERGRIMERFDCFRGTRVAHKFFGSLEVYSVNFLAVKPSESEAASAAFPT